MPVLKWLNFAVCIHHERRKKTFLLFLRHQPRTATNAPRTRKKPLRTRPILLLEPPWCYHFDSRDEDIHDCSKSLSAIDASSTEPIKLKSRVFLSNSTVAFPDILLSTKRSKPSVATLQYRSKVVQKYLTIQLRMIAPPSPSLIAKCSSFNRKWRKLPCSQA